MSFESRRRRDAVSRHVVPQITRDAFEATVYVQAWTHRETQAVTVFDVLAFPDQAEDHGVIRLSSLPGAEHELKHMVLTANKAVIDASMDRRASIVAIEQPEEGEARRATWKRTEDGPGDPDPNGFSASERNAEAYETDRRMR
jgi:hypothetical protein